MPNSPPYLKNGEVALRVPVLPGRAVPYSFFALAVVGAVFLVQIAAGIRADVASPPPSPVITVNPDVYYPLDEVLYVEGRALPGAAVQIQFQKQGSKPVRFTVKSDASGEWVLAEKVMLEAGDWELRARQIGASDLNAEWSNPKIFKVIKSGVTVGGVNIKFAALSLVIFTLLILGATMLWYFSWRVRRLKTELVQKEVREAKESVAEGLSEIRRDLLDELRTIGSSGRNLSSADIERKEHLLRELDKIERTISREIGDIESKT